MVMYTGAIACRVRRLAVRNLKWALFGVIVWVCVCMRSPEADKGISFTDVEAYRTDLQLQAYNGILNCDTQKDKQHYTSTEDPRKVPAAWVKTIIRDLEKGVSDLKVPFSWSDLLSITPFEQDCVRLFEVMGASIPSSDIRKSCSDIDGAANVFGPLNFSTTEQNLRFFGRTHLQTAPSPQQVVLLLQNTAIVSSTYESNVPLPCGLSYSEELRALERLVKNSPTVTSFKQIQPGTRSIPKEDFFFMPKAMGPSLIDSLVHQLSVPKAKYFNEPKIKGGGHYDWRFFNKLHLSDYERITYLHKLTRAWFKFAEYAGLDTWAAHGTLLGWYWNGMNLPWDNDVDVQISMKSLLSLAERYNQSLVVQASLRHEDALMGQYFIDVNTQIFDRTKSNGNNVIDARFIDIRTGLYIDITALSYTSASKSIEISTKQSLEFNKLLDPEYTDNERSQTMMISELHKRLFDRRADLVNSKSIFNCKNNHFYAYEELSELLPVVFEGIRSYVPKGYKEILKREYPRGIYYNVFNKHKWDPKLRIWVKEGRESDPDTMVYSQMTYKMTSVHKQNMYYKGNYLQDIETGFVDPWLVAQTTTQDS